MDYNKEHNCEAHHRSLSVSEVINDCYAVFQPIYNIDDMSIISFEALLRHPIVSTDEIINWAEKYGYMHEIFEVIVSKAISVIMHTGVPVTVNISPSQIISNAKQVEGLLNNVISKHKVPQFHLNIEVTEAVPISDIDAFMGGLHKIKKIGVKVFLDDFGAGHSSFSMLRNGIFDAIKMDKTIVHRISNNRLMQHFLSSILTYASMVGMHVVAEGVEKKDDFIVLKSIGISLAQGYLFSKPLDQNSTLKLFSIEADYQKL